LRRRIVSGTIVADAERKPRSGRRRCLVTGATGLIGSHAVQDLERDFDVVRVSRRGEVAVDFSKPWSTNALQPECDAVVHLAQSENYRDFPAAAGEMFEVNTASAARLLDHAAKSGASLFVFASSGGIYGSGPQPFGESDPPAIGSALG